MHLTTEAIVCGVIRHGETGVVARLLTPQDGMQAGYVRGGRSRALRPVLVAGNVVRGAYRSRTDTQLAALTVELVHSRAPLLAEPLAAAAIEWTTALAVTVLPEGQAYPQVHAALEGMLGAIESAPSARGWAAALVRYEYLLLAELGFGLDLSACIVTGVREDLLWVSPKSGAAVSRAAGAAYSDRLLALPGFLRGGGAADWDAIHDGLRLTGHFLRRDLLTERRAILWAARERLIVRLQRAAG